MGWAARGPKIMIRFQFLRNGYLAVKTPSLLAGLTTPRLSNFLPPPPQASAVLGHRDGTGWRGRERADVVRLTKAIYLS